ncbi:MAG: hypothetical protein LUD47_07880 [Clostridia bacterium]|nr:hypothetical protein [Clostridia bacterium]
MEMIRYYKAYEINEDNERFVLYFGKDKNEAISEARNNDEYLTPAEKRHGYKSVVTYNDLPAEEIKGLNIYQIQDKWNELHEENPVDIGGEK